MSLTYCSVDGCDSKVGSGLSFFRCPSEPGRSQTWKNLLGFTGSHRYADLTPEQSHNRVRICALHFDETCFANSSRSRIHSYSLPSIGLPTEPCENKVKCEIDYDDASIQTEEIVLKFEESEPVIQKDARSQTSAKLFVNRVRENSLRTKIRALEKKVKQLEHEKTLQRQITIQDVLKFFEENYSEESCKLLKAQISLLHKSSRGCRYTDEYKQFALSLYFLGEKAYKRFSSIYRLPSKGTLQRMARQWVVNPGFNDLIFSIIECKVHLLKEKERDCILCLDEISLKPHLFYDISKDKIVGLESGDNRCSAGIATTALTITARGIASSWNQPVAYFFYKTSPPVDDVKGVLFETVRRLRAFGLNIFGVVSNQGSSFYKLVTEELTITEKNPIFFVDDAALVYLFDIPRLLRSTRNHFLSHVFLLNGDETRKSYLETMYNLDKTKQFRLAPKLTQEHIYPNNVQKTKVKFASQVFSHSVSIALHAYVDFNVLPESARTTANFVKNMNDLFDLLNSSDSEDLKPFVGTEKQNKLLAEMDDIFKDLQVLNTNGKNVTKQMEFIFEWRLTIKAVGILWEMLQAKGHKHLFTRNLHQNGIEKFLDQIRNRRVKGMIPTPIQFCRTFKKMFGIRHFDQPDGVDCIEDDEVLSNLTPGFTQSCRNVISMPTCKYTPVKVFTNDYRHIKSSEGNALVDVIQYLLKKCLVQHTCDTCLSFIASSKDLISQETIFSKITAFSENKTLFGGLAILRGDIVEYIIQLENIFVEKFNEFACRDSVATTLKNEFSKISFDHPCKDFPLLYLVSLYTRVRIYYTLKFINSEIKNIKLDRDTIKLKILKSL